MSVDRLPALRPARIPWKKGRIIGQKRPMPQQQVWSVRVRLEMTGKPVRFEITAPTLLSVERRMHDPELIGPRSFGPVEPTAARIS